jgi:hypothetical protein|tara:strand:+ start:425 stop:628 length:204 start_codon:yes stop_codon:yes gene_type:complete
MFSVTNRLGIGFDIESSDGTCYIIEGEDDCGEGYAVIAAFEGLTVTIPFFKILWGEFHEIDTEMLDN